MLLTMALCGLWHGASWNFVLWGTLQGCAIVFVSFWRRYGLRVPAVAGWALTISFILITDVLFRAGASRPHGISFRASRFRRAWIEVMRAYPIMIGAAWPSCFLQARTSSRG